MKDPLTKSESFVSMLREHCSKVHIRELNAGEWMFSLPLPPIPLLLKFGFVSHNETQQVTLRTMKFQMK
jgi:hypothetical protein